MIEERELLEKLGRYLHLARRGLVGYAFLLSTLPVVTMILAIALNKTNRWYWSIPIIILWMIWVLVQGRGIQRRNKVCAEILNMKGAGEKWSPRLREMMSISKTESSLLFTIILSPFAAVPAIKFFRVYKTLSKDYEVEWEEKMGKLSPITITHRRGL